MTKALLPWRKHKNVGFKVATNVKPSLVEGAGYGRFASERIACGEICYSAKIRDVDDFLLDPVENSTVAVAINLTDEAGLDKIETWLGNCVEANPVAVRNGLSEFIAGVPKIETDNGVPICFVLSNSQNINHADDPNMKMTVRDGQQMLEATRDIAPGEELYYDYNTFYYPPGVLAWLKKYGLKSCREQVNIAMQNATANFKVVSV